MDDRPEDTRREINQMSSERIRVRLVREGYDEEQILALDRDDLLDTLARRVFETERRSRKGVAETERRGRKDRERRRKGVPETAVRIGQAKGGSISEGGAEADAER